jgi:methionyl-tRNA formyltransferase
MKVILIGQAAFAEKVLAGLRTNGHEIAAVYCPPDSERGKTDPVKALALSLGLEVKQHKSLKGDAVRQEFIALDADIAVLAYVTQIVPQSVFEVPRYGSICFHPSLLPRYRGGSAINWQLINGEQETGVSIFWVDPGIDTGPLLLQKKASIRPDDTAGSLYYDTLFPLGVDAVLEAVELIATNKAPAIPQEESQATYDPLCTDAHAEIDWAQPVDKVYNLIRGCDPQPGSFTVFRGQKLRLYDCRKVEGRKFESGVIADVANGLVIGAAGGAIRTARVRLGQSKVAAAELVSEQDIQVGERLG